MSDHQHEVRIHIDQKLLHSPNPTSGADLYELGHVPDGKVLYKEVQGDHEDKLVRIDSPKIELTEDEHFHSGDAPEKHYVIIVNTDPVVVDHDVLTFDELVKIAFPVLPTGTDPEFTVSFEHAKSIPHHGDLPQGGSVTVKKHGTIFDVDHTNRS
ncbi:multiubiquitin domain-containing protein [Bradyrhizobium acaciae]|uniref:multiubiquitin domain-containing protein n=1 Tax=Bradyrhizobium acaciae TaxID=2683706 RepID=UPI001E575B90|nr:multiubiquitin domain-containing protein [Bradyrhizobium acaciae]MCC8978304.1 multiubiquitin domain-containing protein [Bradyrhizobium acaciae]